MRLIARPSSAKLARMQAAVAAKAPDRKPFIASLATLVRANVTSVAEVSLVGLSAVLLILSFPNSDLWPLAWIGLVPLFVVIGRATTPRRAFLLGWLWGAIFFCGSCWWVTYSMIHYGHIRPPLAYFLLLLLVALVAVFPALFCLVLTRCVSRFGPVALLVAPFAWISFEWVRLVITGEMWNAIGYSQAFHPLLIQTARWGGVYAVGFLIVTVNAAIAFALTLRTKRAIAFSLGLVLIVLFLSIAPQFRIHDSQPHDARTAVVVGIQPNVPMADVDDAAEAQLLKRHLELSMQGLSASRDTGEGTRLVIWPESPMSFTYTTDAQLQKTVADFATAHRASVLLNSFEPAPNSGGYNSAVMVNEEGRIVAQYDKIRLMPFGEYVPLPHWLPGVDLIPPMVGDFTPGHTYSLMPFGQEQAGVFICFESAFPAIARTFTNQGADVLINISNDGYLGPTPVMRQHLANAIFRAVENDRDVLRVTNTGITVFIAANGAISDPTRGFEPAVRTWTVTTGKTERTLYTRYGDLFVYGCAVLALGFCGATFATRRNNVQRNA